MYLQNCLHPLWNGDTCVPAGGPTGSCTAVDTCPPAPVAVHSHLWKRHHHQEAQFVRHKDLGMSHWYAEAEVVVRVGMVQLAGTLVVLQEVGAWAGVEVQATAVPSDQAALGPADCIAEGTAAAHELGTAAAVEGTPAVQSCTSAGVLWLSWRGEPRSVLE
jgi:hypothetical protein